MSYIYEKFKHQYQLNQKHGKMISSGFVVKSATSSGRRTEVSYARNNRTVKLKYQYDPETGYSGGLLIG